ncbi:MAG: aminotransferase class III-fold pyridoxal phosphate-dependent enzyme [Planctomycetota bacterium]|nr:aspartate aminotransferase family protein [Deltaproteobacteria bacterium]MDP6540427.1 aminotransferase class III-fold pyridoxal phosphate-dependent enzyme [Planctomycetota bacterium]
MDPERAALYPFLGAPGRGVAMIQRSEGVHFVLADGRRILDAGGGAIVANIGHGRAEVAEAAARALERNSYVVPPFATEERVALVERLRRSWLPPALTRCVFTSGGSEAVDSALRLVRQHHLSAGRPERVKVIARERSYHGTTLATLGVGGHEKRRRGFEPFFVDHPRIPAWYPIRRPGVLEEIAGPQHGPETLLAAIEAEGPDSVAAFIAEPVGGSTMGAVVPPDDYWPRIREICSQYGVLLVADEIMCGFGRTGRSFALDHWGVVPDVLIGGKGLAGGYAPIGGVFATEEVVAPIVERGDELMFFTYSAHPMACAVADKVLEIMEREHLVERAARLGEALAKRLSSLEAHPHVAQARGRGLMQAVELVEDPETLRSFPRADAFIGKVVAAGLGRGVFFYPGGSDPARDVVCFGPPATITHDHIEEMARVLEAAIDAAAERVLARRP